MLDEERRGTRKKEGRGGRRDEEEGGTRRKEGRGGRRDGEEEGTGRKEGQVGRCDEDSEKMKKSLKDASLASLGLVLFLSCFFFSVRKLRIYFFICSCFLCLSVFLS